MDEEEFTDEFVEDMCRFMYMIEVMKKYPEITETFSDIKKQYDELCNSVAFVFSQLTEDQCNVILEQHQQVLVEMSQSEVIPQVLDNTESELQS